MSYVSPPGRRADCDPMVSWGAHPAFLGNAGHAIDYTHEITGTATPQGPETQGREIKRNRRPAVAPTTRAAYHQTYFRFGLGPSS